MRIVKVIFNARRDRDWHAVYESYVRYFVERGVPVGRARLFAQDVLSTFPVPRVGGHPYADHAKLDALVRAELDRGTPLRKVAATLFGNQAPHSRRTLQRAVARARRRKNP